MTLLSLYILRFLKFRLGGAAHGTYPSVRYFFERRSRGNSTIRVTNRRVIDPTANRTLVLFQLIASFFQVDVAGGGLGGSATFDLMIVFIAHTGFIVQDIAVNDFPDEYGVRADIHFASHFSF